MRTARARRLLRWRPRHTSKATLAAMVEAHHAEQQARTR
jgi:nucleoside-diphosphate-sugar epimerase